MGGNQAAWGMLLLPYCEFKPIYNLVNFNNVMTSTVGTAPNRNIDQIQLVLNLFKCPSSGDSAAVTTSRCGGGGNDFKGRTTLVGGCQLPGQRGNPADRRRRSERPERPLHSAC